MHLRSSPVTLLAFRRSALVAAVSCGVAFGLAIAAPAGAADEDAATAVKGSGPQDVAAAPPLRLPIYVPPKVGKPARTVGGGSRGPGDGIADLYVLVPDHVGQTASEQPMLYWFIDKVPEGGARIAFTLLDEDGIDPVVQVDLDPIDRPGIHRIRLADYGAKLKPGVEYEWSVALVTDEGARAKDVVSTGFIDRVAAPDGLAAALQDSGPDGSIEVYASLGLWYDALAAIDEQLTARPNDNQLTQARAALLRQVGLTDVANSKL